MKKPTIFNAFKVTEDVWKRRIFTADISDHPGAKGDVAENAWRELLKAYLPSRYRVCSGFVISCEDKRSHQIDCIIYDNIYTPTFFGEHGIYYIPAEAVYAVFEIKQKVNKRNILYASNKVDSVRSLYRTSAPYIGDGQEKPPKPSIEIIGGLLACKIGKWSTQIPTLNSLQPTAGGGGRKYLDSILTAEKGSADYFLQGYPASDPTIYSSEGGLIMGVLRLVQALQVQGTVPAIDWNKWLNKSKS